MLSLRDQSLNYFKVIKVMFLNYYNITASIFSIVFL